MVSRHLMVDGQLKIKTAVLMGGIGPERQISLDSGRNVAEAIEKAGIETVSFDITPEDMSILDDKSIDVFFPILHGEFGEDGQLQKILEEKGLCYTGSDSVSSRLVFDKSACKRALAGTKVKVAAEILISPTDTAEEVKQRLGKMPGKIVVKPTSSGSSVGISICSGIEEAAVKAVETSQQFGECMAEEFVKGKEVTAAVLNGRVLPIIEIRPKSGFYDYKAKYEDDSTEFLFDTIEDPACIEKINAFALEAFKTTGCSGWGRVDFILTDQMEPVFLEINTLPGFTSHSLVPMAGAKAGLSSSDVCVEIIKAAMADFMPFRAVNFRE